MRFLRLISFLPTLALYFIATEGVSADESGQKLILPGLDSIGLRERPKTKAPSSTLPTTISNGAIVSEPTTYELATEKIECSQESGDIAQKSVPLYLVYLLSKWSDSSDLRINQIKSGDPAVPNGVVEFSFGPIHKCLADKIGTSELSLTKEGNPKILGFEVNLKETQSIDSIVQSCIEDGALIKTETGTVKINPSAPNEHYRDVKYTANVPDEDYLVYWKSEGPFGANQLFPFQVMEGSVAGERPCATYENPRSDVASTKKESISLKSKKTILEDTIAEMCCVEGGLESYEDAIKLAQTHNLGEIQRLLEEEYRKSVAKEFESTFESFKDDPENLEKYIETHGVQKLYDLIEKYEKEVIGPMISKMDSLYKDWEKAKKNNKTSEMTRIQREIEVLQGQLRDITSNLVNESLVKLLESKGEWSLAKGIHNIFSYKPYLKLARIGAESKKLYSSTVVKDEMADLRQDYDNQMDEKQVEYLVANGFESAPSVKSVQDKYQKILEREYKNFKVAHCAATEKAQRACSLMCQACNLGWSSEQCMESGRSLAQFPNECTQCAESHFSSSSCKGYMYDYKHFPEAYETTKKRIIEKFDAEVARAEKLTALEEKYRESNGYNFVTVEEGDESEEIPTGEYSSSVSSSSSSSTSSSSSGAYSPYTFNPMYYNPGTTSSMWNGGIQGGFNLGGGFGGGYGQSYMGGYPSFGMGGYGGGYGGYGGYGSMGGGYQSNPFGFANGSGMSSTGSMWGQSSGYSSPFGFSSSSYPTMSSPYSGYSFGTSGSMFGSPTMMPSPYMMMP